MKNIEKSLRNLDSSTTNTENTVKIAVEKIKNPDCSIINSDNIMKNTEKSLNNPDSSTINTDNSIGMTGNVNKGILSDDFNVSVENVTDFRVDNNIDFDIIAVENSNPISSVNNSEHVPNTVSIAEHTENGINNRNILKGNCKWFKK